MPEIKKFLGEYELVREIGKGGFGTVYLARDKAGNFAALKYLEKSASGREIEFLKTPNKNLSGCEFHNILPVLDAFETEEGVFYTMPLADPLYPAYPPENPLWREKSLANLIHDKEINPSSEWFGEKEVFEIAKPLFKAAMFLGEAAVLHRDIKPANVIFWNGEAFLADFSTAKNDADFENLQEAGTEFYRAPQGYIASGGNPDMWGLAATLFYVMTGNPLPLIDRASAIYPKRMAKSLTDAQKERYKHWRRCILRAISENPRQRFLRMKDFRDAFFADDFSVSKLIDAPAGFLNEAFYGENSESAAGGLAGAVENKINKLASETALEKGALEAMEAAQDFLEAGDFLNAAKSLDAAIACAPQTALFYVMRGACKFSLKEYRHALADYEKAAALDESLAEARRGMAHCYSAFAEAALKEKGKNPAAADEAEANIKLAALNMIKAAELGDASAKNALATLKEKGLFREE